MGEMAEWALEQAEKENEANGHQHEPTLPELMIEALRDGSYWVNRDGHVVPLSEMGRAYALNVMNLLRRLADASTPLNAWRSAACLCPEATWPMTW